LHFAQLECTSTAKIKPQGDISCSKSLPDIFFYRNAWPCGQPKLKIFSLFGFSFD